MSKRMATIRLALRRIECAGGLVSVATESSLLSYSYTMAATNKPGGIGCFFHG